MNGLEYQYTGLGVCIWDGVFVKRMGCLYTGWSVIIRDGVLIYGLGGSNQDGVLIYRMTC